MRDLSKALLGQPAIEAMSIVSLVEPVTLQSNSIIQQFPRVFQGLGRLKDSIQLNYTATRSHMLLSHLNV